MILTDRQVALLNFVKIAHKHQVRKYTDEPYITHLIAVADKVIPYVDKYPLIWEVALCHDLFEDTEVTYNSFQKPLRSFGYSTEESFNVSWGVSQLTDTYTSKDYPDWNRNQRKRSEAMRLGGISPLAQTVKYADMIDNTSSIVDHDHKFAKVYLEEKGMYLKAMRNGEWDLYVEAVGTLYYSKILLQHKLNLKI